MRPSVRAAFVPFSAPLEGVLGHMYLDVLGLVTCAIGNLVDPVEYAIGLPWLRADGSRATEEEIRAEWTRIKARKDWRLRGGGVFKSIALLHLDEAGILTTVSRKLDEMDRQLAGIYPDYPEWSSDGQLGALSMSWACGPGFGKTFARLASALRAKDWLRAADECRITTVGNPGVGPRNLETKKLFRNAAMVQGQSFDPGVLYWPRDLLTDATPTLPKLGDDDGEGTPTKTVPEMRPPPFEKVTIIHPRVEFTPLTRNIEDDDPDAA